ncbi:hypothetical protein D3C84_1139550 [compost metagenome]
MIGRPRAPSPARTNRIAVSKAMPSSGAAHGSALGPGTLCRGASPRPSSNSNDLPSTCRITLWYCSMASPTKPPEYTIEIKPL